jgi:hypothetical protein
VLLGLAIMPASAGAGQIVLPAAAFDRDGRLSAFYRAESKNPAKGRITITWTDVYDRLIEQRSIPVDLRRSPEVPFTLDLRRAVAMQNTLSVRLSLDGTGPGESGHDITETSFVTHPPGRAWWEYQIIMWQARTAQQYAALKKLGVTAGAAVYKDTAHAPPTSLLGNDLRWYVENIATDFYSAYHRLSPGRPKNWKFLEAKERYRKSPESMDAFIRDPSLSDPAWLTAIRDRLVDTARANAPYRPLFYNLGDEPGIADLSAFWDFDYSPHSLTGFRLWLKERYATLAALNRQWGASFPSWDAVMPETTNEAMRRTDGNFSAWSDFKEWMDEAFARAVKVGTDAVKSVDPMAYVAIEGAQQPGWGGYDYSRLTQLLDAMEPYNVGGNVEIIRSLNPKVVVLTTSPAAGPWEKHRVWYELLHGSRGLILWDPKSEFVGPEGGLGPRGAEAEPYFRELRGGIGATVIDAEREAGPIAILYSPASLRIEWMLEHKPQGEAWTKRSASSDEDGPMRWLRESYCRLLEDLGRPYTFVTPTQLERGDVVKSGYRVLILPRTSAMSEAEALALRGFVEQGGVLIADGRPGAYDGHGRKLSTPHLHDFFAPPFTGLVRERSFGRGKAVYLNMEVVNYHRDRLVAREEDLHRVMGQILDGALGPAEFRLAGPAGGFAIGVEMRVFRTGTVRIVTLQSNPSFADVAPADAAQKRFETPRTVVLNLPGERYVYDMRAGRPVGRRTQLTVLLDPYEPAIFSISPTAMSALKVSAPRLVRAGETGVFTMRLVKESPAALHVFHLDAVDPSGTIVPQYSGNIRAPKGRATARVPFALNDPPGTWEIRVKDLLSGQTQVSTVRVEARR